LSILLHLPHLRTEKVTKSECREPKTSSILLISGVIFIAIILVIILVMYIGILYTESSMKQYSMCRDKIIGYEQGGIYTSPEEFRLALSYCD
jgi:hypothetical protein